jgi:hypothetical protein
MCIVHLTLAPTGEQHDREAVPSQPARWKTGSSLRGNAGASRELCEKLAGPLLEEYLHLKDLEGTVKELCEKFATATIGWFVEAVLNIVIEKNEKARVMSGGLFAAMVGVKAQIRFSKLIQFLLLQVTRQLLEPGQFMAALCEILSLAEDLLVDIPKFWDFIAQVGVLQIESSLILQMVFVTPPSQIVAPVLVPSGPLPLSSLKESAVTAKLLEGEQLGAKCAGGKYTAAVGVKYT